MELEVQLAKVIEEKGLLSRGKAQLQQTEVRLRCESVQLEHEKQVVEKERANLLERMDLAESSGQEANTLNLVMEQWFLYHGLFSPSHVSCSQLWLSREKGKR